MLSSISAVITDLDGTLLNENRALSPYTVSVLSRCRRQGILVWIATARPLRIVREWLPELVYDAIAVHNGARVYAGGRCIARRQMPAAAWKETVSRLQAYQPQPDIAVEIEETLYANYDVASLWPSVSYHPFTDTDSLPDCPADKLLVLSSALTDMERYRPALAPDCHMQLSERTAAMIMHTGASKANAIAACCRFYGIRPEQTAAFGDDYNDIAMLQNAGIGIAVSNGEEEVKQAADLLIGSNQEDSVARWIETHLLRG